MGTKERDYLDGSWWAIIKTDVYRRRGSSAFADVMKLLAIERTFRPIFTLRLYQALQGRRLATPLRLLVFMLHRYFCNAAAIDLPAKTPIGSGLDISHGWGLVVTGRAILGNNVTLFHGATIGQGDKIAADGSRTTSYPVLEDDVWIGPHAAVLGGIVIGAGSRIMPGAIVTFDVPPYSMVAGNPAIVIKTDCTIDTRNKAPIIRSRAA